MKNQIETRLSNIHSFEEGIEYVKFQLAMRNFIDTLNYAVDNNKRINKKKWLFLEEILKSSLNIEEKYITSIQLENEVQSRESYLKENIPQRYKKHYIEILKKFGIDNVISQ